MRFHHVALASTDIRDAYAALMAACPDGSGEGSATALTDVAFDSEQGVLLQLLDVGGLPVELVQDVGEGPVAGWLKRGSRLYHVCYEVDDLDQTLEDASRRIGTAVVSSPKPAVLFEGRRVAFVIDRVLGLVEFLEKG